MATLSNWSGNNRQTDILPDDTARTVLNLINTYEDYLQTLGLDTVLGLFQQHAASTDNPHKVLIDNLPDLILEALWNYYQTNIQSEDPDPIQSMDALGERFTLDPSLVFEWMRCILLNTDLVYQEGIGPLVPAPTPSTPFYLRTDPIDAGNPVPWYVSDTLNPDLNYYVEGTPSGILQTQGRVSGMVLTGSFRVDVEDTTVWRLAISPDGSETNALILTYVGATRTLRLSSTIPELVLLDGGISLTLTQTTTVNNAQGVPVSENVFPTEHRFALKITTTDVTLYGYANSAFTKVSAAWSTPSSLTGLLKYTLSHPIWNPATPTVTDAVTLSIKCYNNTLTDQTVQLILDGEY